MSTGGSDEVALPAERREVLIRVADEDSLRTLLQRPLDFGCRPVVNRTPDGAFEVPVIVTDEVLAQLREEGMHVEVLPTRDLRSEVGSGNRFADRSVVPRGFGEKTGGTST